MGLKIPIPKPGFKASEQDDKDAKIAELMQKIQEIQSDSNFPKMGEEAKTGSSSVHTQQMPPPPPYPTEEREVKTEFVPIPFEEYVSMQYAEIKELLIKILEGIKR